MNKPLRLYKGDTIGIIAPGSGLSDKKRLFEGINILENLGYNVLIGRSCFEKNGYLSGIDALRIFDIDSFFKNPKVNAIICLRGGYGSIRLLDKIDYIKIIENPKIFVGYSDITALLISFHKRCNLVTFHGPMLSSDIADNDPFTMMNLIDSLEGRISSNSISLKQINAGNCKGRILGGNLSVLCSIVGSKYNINWKNKILFIEEINEEPYRIDRMLYQLKLSGVFEKLNGVVLGQFTDCISKDEDSQTVVEVFNEFFYNFSIPVYTELPAGHGLHKMTIPIGANIEINNNVLKFTEEGVR